MKYKNYEKVLHACKLWHGDQKRKYTNLPYWTHPRNVAQLLISIDAPNCVVMAALLHDVIEDTGYLYKDITNLAGTAVGNLVLEVTDVSTPESGNRKSRKALDREHIAKASYWGKAIKLADLIDNTRSIVRYDKEFAKTYLQEKAELLQVLSDSHPALFRHAKDILILSSLAIKLDISEVSDGTN